ncbi:MAG: hypothetical protein V4604_12205 [Bacteroidota bacterium]
MKKGLVFISAIIMVLAACSPRTSDTVLPADGVENESVITEETPKDSLSAFYGTILNTQSYCGGARPPQELLTELATPKPYGNRSLVFVHTVSHKEYGFVTDEHGHYEVELPLGKYELRPGKRYNNEEENYTYDPNCSVWLKHVFSTLEVLPPFSDNIKDFTVHIPCDPCDPNIRLRP